MNHHREASSHVIESFAELNFLRRITTTSRLGASLICRKFDIDTVFKSDILNQCCSDRMLRRGLSPSSNDPNQKMLAE